MGAARLLAKAWVMMCLFTGAHALRFALQGGGDIFVVIPQVLITVLLFAAMGLLFVGGYGASSEGFHRRAAAIKASKLKLVPPSFNDSVFIVFAVLSFADQIWYAPHHVGGPITEALEHAIYFAVPGHAVIADRLEHCALDGGRIFASAFSWLLAIVFAGSAISRLKQSAEAIRRDRAAHPFGLSLTALAAALGVMAVFGIQILFVGSVLALLPCSAFAGVPGALLIGFGPLLLAYLIYAALAALLASGRETTAA